MSTQPAHSGPLESIAPALEYAVAGINLVGAAVLTWGVLVGVIGFVRIESRRMSRRPCEGQRAELRRAVGFYLLLALELLIAADIIETMVKPTLEQLALLGGVVVIRIAVSWSLTRELSHESQSISKDPERAH